MVIKIDLDAQITLYSGIQWLVIGLRERHTCFATNERLISNYLIMNTFPVFALNIKASIRAPITSKFSHNEAISGTGCSSPDTSLVLTYVINSSLTHVTSDLT